MLRQKFLWAAAAVLLLAAGGGTAAAQTVDGQEWVDELTAAPAAAEDRPLPPIQVEVPTGRPDDADYPPESTEEAYLNEWNSISYYDSAGPIIDAYFVNEPLYDLSGLNAAQLARVSEIQEELRAIEAERLVIENRYMRNGRLSAADYQRQDDLDYRFLTLSIELEDLYFAAF